MQEKEINLKEYAYNQEQKIEIPGMALIGLLDILNTVKDQETKMSFTDKYDFNAKENFEGELLHSVDSQLKPYTTATAYFNQEPQQATSMLGVMALEMLLGLKSVHLDNINAGIAKKIGTVTEVTQDAETIKLS